MRTRDLAIRRDDPAAEGERGGRADNQAARLARVDAVVAEALREGVRLEKLWIVTTPTINSTIGDICFEATAAELARQVLGGLKPEEIRGVFTGAAAAADFARAQFAEVAARLYAEADQLRVSAQAMHLRGHLENPAAAIDPARD